MMRSAWIVLLLATSQGWCTSLTLLEDASVYDKQIRVADVLTDSSSLPQEFAERTIGMAPQPGETRDLPLLIIQNALRSWEHYETITWAGAAKCTVFTPAKRFDDTTLQSILETALVRELKGEGNIRVLDFRNDQPIILPDLSYSIEVGFPANFQRNSWCVATLRFLVNGEMRHAKNVRFQWSWEREVWQANRTIESGEALHAADFSLTLKNVLDLNSEPVLGAFPADDAIASRPVRSGDVLSLYQVKQRDLVKRGSPVQVHFRTAGVRVTMNGTALQDGSRGEIITIRNDASRKSVHARVVEEGILEYVN